jgi:ribose transport system ATP-binding protein
MHDPGWLTQMAEPIIVMEGIEKTFPGVHALSNCRFDLFPGEVHALVGENGAGKSTLMKILAGVYQKDAGRVTYKGKDVHIPNPRAAQHLGISIIHQELNLMQHLTAAQNIYIGREPHQAVRLLLDEKRMNELTRELFDMLHMDLDPRTKVMDLAVAKQQMVEIAKALSFNAEVLIMDEPTAALNIAEIEELFRIIRQLRDRGVGVAYISHRLEELKQISDRITVMRDGNYVDTRRTTEVEIGEIISMMVGRTIYETSRNLKDTSGHEVVLKVAHLQQGRTIKDVSFEARAGEILGFAGLMGAGRTEVARAVFGADPVQAGEISVQGRRVHIRRPSDAVRHGIGYLSEDRKRFGLALGMDVEANIVMATMKRFLGWLGIIRRGETRATAEKFVSLLSIKTPGLTQLTKFLSGGNQQKVVVGKWLVRDCNILFFDEPTRGIDVGAKSEIYKLLNDLAEQGKAVIMISSELPEIIRMSHRIVVMCEGRITGELTAAEATQEKIMHLATRRESVVKTESMAAAGKGA